MFGGPSPIWCCPEKWSGLNRISHPHWVKICVDPNGQINQRAKEKYEVLSATHINQTRLVGPYDNVVYELVLISLVVLGISWSFYLNVLREGRWIVVQLLFCRMLPLGMLAVLCSGIKELKFLDFKLVSLSNLSMIVNFASLLKLWAFLRKYC